MIKTFCDRCGKEISKIDGQDAYCWLKRRLIFTKTIIFRSYRHDDDEMCDDKYICPECTDSYIHWFMNPENVEEKK